MSRGELHESDQIERLVRLGDVIEIFRDSNKESISEGYAKVWAILEENQECFALHVSFLSDPKAPARKFTREYKRKA